MVKLYLARHGDAVLSETDPKRPLSLQGVENVTRIANEIAASSATVQQAFHSGKLRALQTAQIFAKVMLKHGELQQMADLLPNDPIQAVIRMLADLDKDTLLVGHLPFMPILLARLVPQIMDNSDSAIQFNTGTMVCLVKQQHWSVERVFQRQSEWF